MPNNNNNNNNSNNKRKRSNHNKTRYSVGGGGTTFGITRNRTNPRRGGPGMLLTCESGREGKCKRDGLEILRHYYYLATKRENDVQDVDKKEEGEKKFKESSKKVLSLEEEIALLKSGAATTEELDAQQQQQQPLKDKTKGENKNALKTPFDVYETGIKGIVFVMCTLPHCNLIPSVVVPLVGKNDDGGVENEKEGANEKNEEEEGKMKKIDDANDDKNAAAADADADADAAEEESEQPTSKKLKTSKKDTPNTTTTTTIQSPSPSSSIPSAAPIWDPIQTIQNIVTDIQHRPFSSSNNNNNTTAATAPSSRFVTRMIPIQATCFASLEEIKPTAKLLLQKYFFPLGKKEEGKEEKVSFEINIKRRNCSNVTRDRIIDCIASLVSEYESSYGTKDEKKASSSSSSLFRVDLKQPQYTIQIEICRTLCGMSVVKNGRMYKKFNLLELREDAEEEAAAVAAEKKE